jgi:hypothetical protein
MYYPEYKGELRDDYDRRKDENISRVLDRGVEPVGKPENYLSVKEASTMAGVHPQSIASWVNKGWIKNYKHGVKFYLKREEIQHLIDSKTSSKKVYFTKDATHQKGEDILPLL